MVVSEGRRWREREGPGFKGSRGAAAALAGTGHVVCPAPSRATPHTPHLIKSHTSHTHRPRALPVPMGEPISSVYNVRCAQTGSKNTIARRSQGPTGARGEECTRVAVSRTPGLYDISLSTHHATTPFIYLQATVCYCG